MRLPLVWALPLVVVVDLLLGCLPGCAFGCAPVPELFPPDPPPVEVPPFCPPLAPFFAPALALGKGGPLPFPLAAPGLLDEDGAEGRLHSDTTCLVDPHLRHLPVVGGC